MDGDRLEKLWRKLGQEIREKESELEILRNKFQTLDEARALVLSDGTSGNAAAEKLALEVESNPTQERASLQESVRRYVCESRAPNGVGVTDVQKAMRSLGFGASASSKSFYATIYVTLKRLVERGDLYMRQGERGKMFMRPEDKTRPLFRREIHGELQ